MSEPNPKRRKKILLVEEEEEEEEKGVVKEEEEHWLQLGDILLITKPGDEVLNNNVFFVDYIDPTKIKLINSETFDKTVLLISPEGKIDVQSIQIISRNPEKGFARQNGLLPGTWVNIYFGGELPAILTGKITNLEEDMIELTTVEGDILYINFAYQGIPEDLPIDLFEIRAPIKTKTNAAVDKDETETAVEDEPAVDVDAMDVDDAETAVDESEAAAAAAEKTTPYNLNDIQFGDEVITVQEYVYVDKKNNRYTIQTQANDMLEEMLTAIPVYKRSSAILNGIHRTIARFLQLRQMASTFDANGMVTGMIKRTAEDRPLADALAEFKNRLYWILFVAKNVKKFYFNNNDPIYSEEVRLEDGYEMIKMNHSLQRLKTYLSTGAANFAYKSFAPIMTPFSSPDKNGVMVEGNVQTNLEAMVDTMGDLYSAVFKQSNVASRRFVLQRYNLASEKLQAASFKGEHLQTHRVKLGNNDPIAIHSVLTLPEPAVVFSSINLPGTALLKRANLNQHFLNYWQVLRQSTQVNKIVLDGLDNDIEFTKDNFLNDIKQFVLEMPDGSGGTAVYKSFLNMIVPKIRVLFALMKKYIHGRLSFLEVVQALEPFLVYPENITFGQYQEITRFLHAQINEYNTRFAEYKSSFSLLRFAKYKKETYYYASPLFSAVGVEVMQMYGFEEPTKMTISTSEFLKNITASDFGDLFNTSAAFSNIHLMFPSNLKELFNQDLKKLEIGDRDSSKCTTHIIAKKYYSMETLIADNEHPIYYDKAYDKTNYALLDEKYKSQRDTMPADEFLSFLAKELETKQKLDEASANHMASTLINQAKAVREGDYALLVTNNHALADKMEYYVRHNNRWELDDKVDASLFIKDDDILCNLDYQCIYNTDASQCEDTQESKQSLVQKSLKQIIDQFDNQYDISKTELNKRIGDQLAQYQQQFEKRKKLHDHTFYQYNNEQYNLGLSVKEVVSEKSPHAKLAEMILGQSDFIKRQHDIVKFVTLYCYEGNKEVPNTNDGEMESEWWLYCNETRRKLIPAFYFVLASAFVNTPHKYNEVMDDLKRRIGKRSDDGDAWVDEHSGHILCYIDLDETAAAATTFFQRTNVDAEADAETGDAIVAPAVKKRLSRNGELVSNIVSVLSSNMGIDLESSRDFIIRVVTELLNDTSVIEVESVYHKKEEEMAKKGKKIPSYAVVFASTLLHLSLGAYLIAIQTSIPPIQTRKTVPGCVRSFTGFPLEGEGDDSSVKYVACTALKSRDRTTMPWNVLPNSEEKVVTTMKSFLTRFLMPHADVEQRRKEKVEFMLLHPTNDTLLPVEHDLTKWSTFLPPLRRFHVNHLQNVSDDFVDRLQNDLFTGNYRQLESLLVIRSKCIAFSLAIQEAIQHIVEKKQMLLKSTGKFFMDNACCNESDAIQLTALQYFDRDDPNISLYNSTVASLSALLRDIQILTNSAIFLSSVNTKRIFPSLSNDFSEDTIYRAFIVLCKFLSPIPLTADLAAICVDKPDYLKKIDSLSEKIAKLKRDGRTYTKEQFLRLFQIVSRNNVIPVSLVPTMVNDRVRFQRIIDRLDEDDEGGVPRVLLQHLNKSLDDPKSHLRALKNYLQTSITRMRQELLAFLSTGKSSVLEMRNITKFVTTVAVFANDGGIQFMKNYLELFANTFPSMILNGHLPQVEPPSYWKLAPSHNAEIRKMVTQFYAPLKKFFHNKPLQNVLNDIQAKSKGILALAQNTYVFDDDQDNNKRTTSLLYEYYLLSVLSDYKNAGEHAKQMLVMTDFLEEQQQMHFTEDERHFIEGDALKLKQDTIQFILSILTIMMDAKQTINVTPADVQNRVFQLKEAEKYNFTDKLKDMSVEQRNIDTMMKKYRIGDVYSMGVAKGVKTYDPAFFEHDRHIAEQVAKILHRRGDDDGGDLVDEEDLEDLDLDEEDEANAGEEMNPTDDYNDGDPWGDELDNEDQYD